MRKILLSSLLFYTQFITSQSPGFQWGKWTNGNSNTVPYALASDGLGNVYITGQYINTVDFDPPAGTHTLYTQYTGAFVLKLDQNGNIAWLKNSGGISLAVDPLGNVYTSYGGVYLLKMNPQGDTIWSKYYDPQFSAGFISFDSQGNIYVAGSYWGTGKIQKLDINGQLIWSKTITGAQNEIKSLAVDEAGNPLVTGYFFNTVDFDPGPSTYTLSANNNNAFVLKLDSSGNFLWAKNFGGSGTSWGASVRVDQDNNVYSIGHFTGQIDFDPGAGTLSTNCPGAMDVYVSKLNPSGDLVWCKVIGNKFTQVAKALSIDFAGDLWLGGDFEDSTGYETDFDPGPLTQTINCRQGSFFLKLNALGDFKSLNYIEGKYQNTFLTSLAVNPLGNLFATGYSYTDANLNPSNPQYTFSPGSGAETFFYKLNDVTVGLLEHQNLSAVKVFPNPGESQLTISLESHEKTAIKLFSVTGVLLCEKDATENKTFLDISQLSKGIYVVSVEQPGGIYRAKIVKN